MVGTRKLARLLAHATRADAKVVLVGDHRQLPEIGPGGAFRGLADRLDAAELADNLRQRDPVERDALANLARREDGARDSQACPARTTSRSVPMRSKSALEMVTDWLSARREGRDAVMLASRRRDVRELNLAARSMLVEVGSVAADGIEIDGRTFAVGDSVMALSNRCHLDVTNGDRGVITEVDPQRTGVTGATGPRSHGHPPRRTCALDTSPTRTRPQSTRRKASPSTVRTFSPTRASSRRWATPRSTAAVNAISSTSSVPNTSIVPNLERSRPHKPDRLVADLTAAHSRIHAARRWRSTIHVQKYAARNFRQRRNSIGSRAHCTMSRRRVRQGRGAPRGSGAGARAPARRGSRDRLVSSRQATNGAPRPTTRYTRYMSTESLVCEWCGVEFERPSHRGPTPGSTAGTRRASPGGSCALAMPSPRSTRACSKP